MTRSAWSWIHSRAIASRCVGLAPRSRASATQLAHLHLQAGDQREAERASLVEERGHRHAPAAADLAEDVLDGDLRAREEDLVELRLAGDLRERSYLDAGSVHVDDHVRQPLVPLGGRIGAGQQDAEVRDVRVGRPHLLAVEDEAVSVEPRCRAHAREVGAGARLGEALAPDLVRGEKGLQVARLLLVAAVGHDRRPRHPQADHADVRRRLGAGLLLEVDRLETGREAAAAVLRRPRDPRPARVVEGAAPRPHLRPVEAGGPAAVRAELVGQVLVEPRPDLGAEARFLGGVAEVHRARC